MIRARLLRAEALYDDPIIDSLRAALAARPEDTALRLVVAGDCLGRETCRQRWPRPPGAEFAVAVRGLAALLEAHGLITPDPQGA